MDFFEGYETVYDRVRNVLVRYPETRDSDKLLCLAIYSLGYGLKSHASSYEDLRAWLLSSEVPTFETITRARRKIQEKEEGLRGKNYIDRQQKSDIARDHFGLT